MNNLIRGEKGNADSVPACDSTAHGVGLFLWNQLPDQVPIHFGLNGQADNYAGKAFVVFGLPLLMAALQVLLLVVTMADPRGRILRPNPSDYCCGFALWSRCSAGL